MSKFCKGCGAPLAPDAAFCAACGRAARPETENPVGAAVPGPEIPGPLAFLKARARLGAESLRRLLKSPKQLIPLLALGVFWLILSVLAALGFDPWPVRLLSFLTFAQGGMYGGVWGALGGVIGKGVFACFVSTVLLPLFHGKHPFKGMRGGLRGFVSGLAVKSAHAAALPVLGAGMALIAFNFLTGNAGMVNSMAGIVGFVLAVKSLWSAGGFFWGLVLSLASQMSGGKVPTQQTVSRLIAGYAAGSAAGTALSVFRVPFLPYALGALLLIAGLILKLAARPGKEAASA